MRVITIKKPPSADTALGLLGEWSQFEHRGGPMGTERAQIIAAQLYAASLAYRQGKWMQKDWRKCHPSLPMQMLGSWEKITQHPLVKNTNEPIAFDFELKEAMP